MLLSYLVVTVQVDWNSFAYYRSGVICKCLTPMNSSNSTVVIKTTVTITNLGGGRKFHCHAGK